MSKAVYILSEKSEEIAQATMMELDRGMTGLHAKGMYTRQENVCSCVWYQEKRLSG